MKYVVVFLLFTILAACNGGKEKKSGQGTIEIGELEYAKGFTLNKLENGVTLLEVFSPWPDTEANFTYALVPKDRSINDLKLPDNIDARIQVPVERIVLTSTTHIPALEALGEAQALVGFPGIDLISSPKTRERIAAGKVEELGANESLNTEKVLELDPEVVIGFAVNGQNKSYNTLTRSGIPVVYNGDWMEGSPLGKAEWIRFFAPFFQKERMADSIFNSIERSYQEVVELAAKREIKPTVLSGALYRDVWYTPAGESWAAKFISDANGKYIWEETEGSGSLSLSVESVLANGTDADVWIAPSQFTSYSEMEEANVHYQQIKAFREKRVFTYAHSRGPTGGLLYFELAPNRPDLVLKDLVHYLHPLLLPDYEPVFFKPLAE